MNDKIIWLTGDIKSIEKSSTGGFVIEAIASTGGTDRHLDTVNPDGWDLKNFKKNSVLLWAHDYSKPPVGKVTEIKLNKLKQLVFKAEFADTEFAREIARLYKDKFLNAFSVGYIVKKWGDESKGEFTHMQQELLEISCVPVPANAEALVMNGLSKRTIEILNESAKSLETNKKEAVIYLTITSAKKEAEGEEEGNIDEPIKEEQENEPVKEDEPVEPIVEQDPQPAVVDPEPVVENEITLDKVYKLLNDLNAKVETLTHKPEQAIGSETSKSAGNERYVLVDVESLKEVQRQLQVNDKQNENALKKVKSILLKND